MFVSSQYSGQWLVLGLAVPEKSTAATGSLWGQPLLAIVSYY